MKETATAKTAPLRGPGTRNLQRTSHLPAQEKAKVVNPKRELSWRSSFCLRRRVSEQKQVGTTNLRNAVGRNVWFHLMKTTNCCSLHKATHQQWQSLIKGRKG